MARRIALVGILVVMGPAMANWPMSPAPPTSEPARNRTAGSQTSGGGREKVIGYQALDLSRQQRGQIEAIVQEARAEAAQAGGSQERRAVWREAVERVNRTVLTEEQRERLREMRDGG